ncbi:MAG: OsmC family protein [Promethearchaeota archaeon]
MDSEENVYEVELRWKEQLKIEAKIRNFKSFLMDDRIKGNNSAPTPVEMFLSSIGSCMTMAFLYCCHISKIQLKSADVNVKISGKLGRIDKRLRLIKSKVVVFTIKSSENSLKIQKCFEKFQPFCILAESVRAAIPVTSELKLVD